MKSSKCLFLGLGLIIGFVQAEVSDLPPPPVIEPVTKPDAAASAPNETILVAPKLPTIDGDTTASSAASVAPVAAATTPAPVEAGAVPVVSAPGVTAPVVSSAPVVAAVQPAPLAEHSTEVKPLFNESVATEGASNAKELYEKTAADKDLAQTALSDLEKEKSKSMDSYLAFDKELDDLYDEAGVARGTALADLADAKQYIIDAGNGAHGVDDAAQGVIADHTKLLDSLSKELEALQTQEAQVVATLKVVSDYVLGFADDMDIIESSRMSLMNGVDHSVATGLSAKIKQAADKIVAAQKSALLPGGQVHAYTDALTKAKEKIVAVKKMIEEVKQKKINVAEAVAKVAQRLDQPAPESKEATIDTERGKKKNKKLSNSSWRTTVKGTVFETPYEIVAAVWDFLAPARIMAQELYEQGYAFISSYINNDAAPVADHADAPLADPVLERIRLERTQSHKKVKSLDMQREVIEMKGMLLDRLEAERIMQLDKKEDLKGEISRAYARKDRELSWVELFKRIFWKLYATARRTTVRIIAWWRDEEVVAPVVSAQVRHSTDGVGEPKREVADAPLAATDKNKG